MHATDNPSKTGRVPQSIRKRASLFIEKLFAQQERPHVLHLWWGGAMCQSDAMALHRLGNGREENGLHLPPL